MNRKKKLTQIHKKRVKAVAAKNSGKKKSGYVSKAERAKLEAAAEAEHSTQTQNQDQNHDQN
jgi:hypothetical protein